MSHFGILNLHKPVGVTSRDVVNRVQRLVKPEKCGHAGTLDPLASGVLLVGLGQATRLVECLHELPKSYTATFLLGRHSDTEDIEGTVVELENARPPAREELLAAVESLTGDILQRPPAYSALKIAGKRAYALARAGEAVILTPRPVHIDRLRILDYVYPELRLEVVCSSGTYIRSLGRDLTEQVGNAAVMSALVRTAIGPFAIEHAVNPEQLTPELIQSSILPPTMATDALMRRAVVSDEEVRRLSQGQAIARADIPAATHAAVDEAGRLVALLSPRDDGRFAASRYFPSS